MRRPYTPLEKLCVLMRDGKIRTAVVIGEKLRVGKARVAYLLHCARMEGARVETIPVHSSDGKRAYRITRPCPIPACA